MNLTRRRQYDTANAFEWKGQQTVARLAFLDDVEGVVGARNDGARFKIRHKFRHVIVVGQNVPNLVPRRAHGEIDVHNDDVALFGCPDIDVIFVGERGACLSGRQSSADDASKSYLA